MENQAAPHGEPCNEWKWLHRAHTLDVSVCCGFTSDHSEILMCSGFGSICRKFVSGAPWMGEGVSAVLGGPHKTFEDSNYYEVGISPGDQSWSRRWEREWMLVSPCPWTHLRRLLQRAGDKMTPTWRKRRLEAEVLVQVLQEADTKPRLDVQSISWGQCLRWNKRRKLMKAKVNFQTMMQVWLLWRGIK